MTNQSEHESYLGAKGGSGVYQAIINVMAPHEFYGELFLGTGVIFKMINSKHINSKDYKLLNVKLGSVYLFDNFIVTEFNEGVDINFNNFNEVTDIIKTHFDNRPFGFIANRLNSYSIDLNDATQFNTNFPNLKAYAIVVYNSMTQGIFEIENQTVRKEFSYLSYVYSYVWYGEFPVDELKFEFVESKYKSFIKNSI